MVKHPIAKVTLDDNLIDLFFFGAAGTAVASPNYGSTSNFDTLTSYKLDTRISGRYLSYKMTTDVPKDFAFSGMDIDVIYYHIMV